MTYQPRKHSQFQPKTKLSPKDCVPATCALGAERATVGGIRTNHAVIRRASPDTAGGMRYSDAVAATFEVTGVTAEVRYGISADDLQTLLRAGHACTVSIDTNATAETKYRTNNFRGGHSIYVNSYHASDDTAQVDDPGTTKAGYLDWPWRLLVRAAELRTGGNGINVIVWPDTEGVVWIAVDKGRIRAKPDATSKDVGKYAAGRSFKGGRTQNGGPWKRADGTAADGWVHVKRNLLRWGWIRGEDLA